MGVSVDDAVRCFYYVSFTSVLRILQHFCNIWLLWWSFSLIKGVEWCLQNNKWSSICNCLDTLCTCVVGISFFVFCFSSQKVALIELLGFFSSIFPFSIVQRSQCYPALCCVAGKLFPKQIRQRCCQLNLQLKVKGQLRYRFI